MPLLIRLQKRPRACSAAVLWQKLIPLLDLAGVRLDSCFASWSERLGDLETVVAGFGRVSDLIVVPRPSSGSVQGQRRFDAAVFEGLTLVIGEKLSFALADHVMVAWNGSLEASRAVLGAIPLLHQADRVSIFSAPQCESEGASAPDLAESLQWYGIRAHLIPGLGTRALREQRCYRVRSSSKQQ